MPKFTLFSFLLHPKGLQTLSKQTSNGRITFSLIAYGPLPNLSRKPQNR